MKPSTMIGKTGWLHVENHERLKSSVGRNRAGKELLHKSYSIFETLILHI